MSSIQPRDALARVQNLTLQEVRLHKQLVIETLHTVANTLALCSIHEPTASDPQVNAASGPTGQLPTHLTHGNTAHPINSVFKTLLPSSSQLAPAEDGLS